MSTGAVEVFDGGGVERDAVEGADLRDRLCQEIRQMKVELDWLKKSMSCSLEQRRRWITPQRPRLAYTLFRIEIGQLNILQKREVFFDAKATDGKDRDRVVHGHLNQMYKLAREHRACVVGEDLDSFEGAKIGFSTVNGMLHDIPYAQIRDAVVRKGLKLGRWLALGNSGAVLSLLDARTGRVVGKPRTHDRYVLALGFSKDERFLASSDRADKAFLWEIPSLRPRGVFRGHTDYVRGLAISPDGTQLATASADCTARIWSVAGCRELAVLRGHSEGVNEDPNSPHRRTLATSSYDRTVRLWHVSTFREMAVVSHQHRALRVMFFADGTLIAALARDGSIRFWPAPIAQSNNTEWLSARGITN